MQGGKGEDMAEGRLREGGGGRVEERERGVVVGYRLIKD